MAEAVRRVAVIGAGTMGRGIAQVFLEAGRGVALIDQDEDALEAAVEAVVDGIEKRIDTEALAGNVEQYLERLSTGTGMDLLANADLIIEAVPENVETKRGVFEAAGEHNTGAVYATNTSSIPLEKLVEAVPAPERFVGMHFFNPVPLMDLVEVVKHDTLDRDVLHTVEELVEELGKACSVVESSPGFVSNRILMPFINEAVKALDAGVASKIDIDRVATKGFNHPMGPLELADLIGLDVCVDIMDRIHQETGEDRFKPAPLLKQKVDDGETGKKTGEGFYSYGG